VGDEDAYRSVDALLDTPVMRQYQEIKAQNPLSARGYEIDDVGWSGLRARRSAP
jgi:hypothetical protein